MGASNTRAAAGLALDDDSLVAALGLRLVERGVGAAEKVVRGLGATSVGDDTAADTTVGGGLANRLSV